MPSWIAKDRIKANWFLQNEAKLLAEENLPVLTSLIELKLRVDINGKFLAVYFFTDTPQVWRIVFRIKGLYWLNQGNHKQKDLSFTSSKLYKQEYKDGWEKIKWLLSQCSWAIPYLRITIQRQCHTEPVSLPLSVFVIFIG